MFKVRSPNEQHEQQTNNQLLTLTIDIIKEIE